MIGLVAPHVRRRCARMAVLKSAGGSHRPRPPPDFPTRSASHGFVRCLGAEPPHRRRHLRRWWSSAGQDTRRHGSGWTGSSQMLPRKSDRRSSPIPETSGTPVPTPPSPHLPPSRIPQVGWEACATGSVWMDTQVTEVRVHHAWHQSALGRQTPQGRAQLGMLVGHQPGPQRAPGGSASGPTRRRPYANSRPASAKRGDAMAPMPRRGRTVRGRCVASAAPPMSSYGRGRGLNNLSASAHEGQARPMEAPGMRVIVVGATDVH